MKVKAEIFNILFYPLKASKLRMRLLGCTGVTVSFVAVALTAASDMKLYERQAHQDIRIAANTKVTSRHTEASAKNYKKKYEIY